MRFAVEVTNFGDYAEPDRLTNVTPVARRRPHELAAQVATLDRLSDGRAVLGVGLGGVPAEFEAYGDPSDPGVRAERLDEGLDVVTALWSGDEVHHHGRHFQAEGVRHRLRPSSGHASRSGWAGPAAPPFGAPPAGTGGPPA